MFRYRDVAQLGSALPWGGRGREFKSHRSDQKIKRAVDYFNGFLMTSIKYLYRLSKGFFISSSI